MESEQNVLNNSTVNSALIFEVENLENLVLDAICTGGLQNELADLRKDKIRAFFSNDISIFISNPEIKFISEITSLLRQLVDYIHAKDITKHPNCCEKIFKLIYNYVYYRVVGITHQLETSPKHIYKNNSNSNVTLYYSQHWGELQITESFEEYAIKNIKYIENYLNNPELLSILSQLQLLAPSLFIQPKNIEEELHDHKNIFNEPGINFEQPPFIGLINKLLALLSVIYKNSHTSEIIQELEFIINEFSSKEIYNSILELLYKTYIPFECLAFWPHHDSNVDHRQQFQRLCLTVGAYLTKLIPYNLLDISLAEINKAKKTLLQSKDTQNKIHAGRILKYAAIPWGYIQNIGALLFKSKQIKFPVGEALIFEANKELSLNWKNILLPLQELIAYEVAVGTRKINFAKIEYKPLPESQYFLLKHLGSYAGDVLFLNKIISVLSQLDFKQSFYPETHLRLLGILGEAAKNLSPLIIKRIGEPYWQALAKVRDKTSHTTGYLRRMQEILKDNPLIAEALKNEFQLVLKQCMAVKQNLPVTWTEIKDFYQQDLDKMVTLHSNLGASLNQLLEALESVLTKEDYQHLRATKSHAFTELEIKRDQILKILDKQVLPNSIDQNEFFSTIENFYFLGSKQKKDIKEFYKKLRQAKEAKLSPAIYTLLRDFKAMSDSELELAINKLIKKLKNIDNSETLKKELVKIGLEQAYAIWEEKRQKCYKKVKPSVVKNKPVAMWSLDKILFDSLNAAKKVLEHLKTLQILVIGQGKAKIIPVEQLWNNPILCHAIEFHFVRLRNYIDVIQEALSYLPRYNTTDQIELILNGLYGLLSSKLTNIRLYGNSLAHLHDVTSLDGLTVYGNRLIIYQELYAALQNHKALSSLTTDINSYIKALINQLNETKKNLIKALEDNRRTYETVYKWQQQALLRLPNVKLADYQILATLHTVDDSDADKHIKQQLYKATEKLFQLQQSYLELQKIISPSSTDFNNCNTVNKHAKFGNQKLVFDEEEIMGDGWCTLNAIGIANPTAAISGLKTLFNNAVVVNYIRRAIENNYQSSLALGEDFDIEGVDENNNAIKNKINTLYSNCQDTNNSQHNYLAMMDYLENPYVQTAYINYLLKTRYVDSNIAAACLHAQGKKLALFINYNLPNHEFINCVEDDISPTDPNTVCLVFHPSSRQALAHYNRLRITAVEPLNAPVSPLQNNSSVSNAALIANLSPILNDKKTANTMQDELNSLANPPVLKKN